MCNHSWRGAALVLAVFVGACSAGTAPDAMTAGGRSAIAAEQVATALIGEGRCSDAVDTLNSALAEIPGNARLLTLRGFCEYGLHDTSAARADLDRAITMDAAYFYPLVVRAQIAADAGDIPSGLADLNRAIALAEQDGGDRMRLDDGTSLPVGSASDNRAERAWALTLRAELTKRQGEIQLALKDVAAALRLNPAYPDGWIVRASALRAANLYGAALKADLQALRLEQSARVYREVCFDQVAMNRSDDAVPSCDAGLALQPGAPALLEARGVAYLKLGRFDQARADFDTALVTRPKWATLLYGRALARRALGDASGAAQDLAASRSIVPDIDRIFARWGWVPPSAS